jgi:hypothetical protein
MFRASIFLSSGEFTVLSASSNQQTEQPPIQSDKYQCPIDTIRSSDDGHIDDRNMWIREGKYMGKYVHLFGLI